MDFYNFLQGLGIPTPSQQIATHYFTRWGKNQRYYAIAIDSVNGQGYAVGDWSTGETWSWFPDKDNEISVEEAEKRRNAIKEAREREKQQREDEWHNVAQKVRKRLNVLSTGRNAYLDKKGIEGDFLIDGEKLVIPLSDINGDVWTVQTITPDGSKKLFTGGKKKGCFHRFGNIGDVIYVCEGFATAWSVHYATNECAVMAVDVHNMKPVVDSLVIKYGKEKVVVCADNDGGHNGGIGVEKAKELESKYGVRVAIPIEEGDFNDVHQKDGPKAVRDMVSVKVQRADTLRYKGLDVYNLPLTKDLGLVGEIADWITSTAIRKQPILSVAAALAFVGMVKGHKVQTETGLRTNMLVLSVGQSTSGKDYPRKAIQHLASYCGVADYMKGDPASDTSIIDGVYSCGGKQLMQIDEMGKLLNSLGSKNASSHQSGIVPTIMKMFSSADTIYHGKQYARRDGKKTESIVIDQPCLCINGSTVSENFYSSLTGEHIIDGFLNRWLLFESKEFRPPMNKNKSMLGKPPENLIERIKDIRLWDAQNLGYAQDLDLSPKPVVVRYTDNARKLIDTIESDMDVMIEDMYHNGDVEYPLWGRAVEHIMKVSLILADDNKITQENVENAFQIVMHCVTMMVDAVKSNIASNDYERKKQTILRIIKNAGGSAKLRYISPRCNMPAREYKEILSTLVEGNILIERKDNTGSNKPTIIYELV